MIRASLIDPNTGHHECEDKGHHEFILVDDESGYSECQVCSRPKCGVEGCWEGSVWIGDGCGPRCEKHS